MYSITFLTVLLISAILICPTLFGEMVREKVETLCLPTGVGEGGEQSVEHGYKPQRGGQGEGWWRSHMMRGLDDRQLKELRS